MHSRPSREGGGRTFLLTIWSVYHDNDDHSDYDESDDQDYHDKRKPTTKNNVYFALLE